MIKYTGTPFYLCKDKSNYWSLLSSIKEQCTNFPNVCMTTWSAGMFLNHCVLAQQIRSLNMVKSIVIHTIPKYMYSYIKHIPKNTRKQYFKTFFKFKILNLYTKYHHQKLLISKSMWFWKMNQINKQECLPLGGVYLIMITLLKTQIKEHLPRGSHLCFMRVHTPPCMLE